MRHLVGPLIAAALTTTAPLAACTAADAFDAPLTLGDRVVAPAVLNRGKDLFGRYCASCHGADGRADTPTARRLEPPPRDLTLAHYQRRSDPTPGSLPTDADLRATVRFGIAGTGMPAWPNLDDADLDAVVQFVKALSPRWRGDATASPAGAPPTRDSGSPPEPAVAPGSLRSALRGAAEGEDPRPRRTESVLPARGMAASFRAGQTWRGDATPHPPSRLGFRSAAHPVAALGER